MNNFIKGLKEGQKLFGETIAIIVNSALLSIVYFLGFGVTKFFSKLAKKRFLDQELSKERKSYWEELNLGRQKGEEYFRQF